jgi:hypothetical protein
MCSVTRRPLHSAVYRNLHQGRSSVLRVRYSSTRGKSAALAAPTILHTESSSLGFGTFVDNTSKGLSLLKKKHYIRFLPKLYLVETLCYQLEGSGFDKHQQIL